MHRTTSSGSLNPRAAVHNYYYLGIIASFTCNEEHIITLIVVQLLETMALGGFSCKYIFLDRVPNLWLY